MSKHLPAAVPVLIVLTTLLLSSLPAAAHHVHHEVARGEAVVVTLTYGDGSPLAGDRYDILAHGEEKAFQTGTTDAAGRIVFMPDSVGTWRVRVFSEDGHGADFTFETGPVTAAAEEQADRSADVAELNEAPVNTLTPEVVEAEKKRLVERFAGPALGVGIILALFGVFALFVRSRR